MFDAMPMPPPSFLSFPALAAGALADVRTYSLGAALLRLGRKWPARAMADDIATLAGLGPYRGIWRRLTRAIRCFSCRTGITC